MKSLGVQALRGASARMRPMMAGFRSEAALPMSERNIQISDKSCESPENLMDAALDLSRPREGGAQGGPVTL